MIPSTPGRSIAALVAGALASASAIAGNPFENFTPLTASAGPTANEAAPITFGNPAFRQVSIADRSTQLAANIPNSGNWDMITLNETGFNKGRYLFTVFETGSSGVQRQDLATGRVDTIWQSPSTVFPTNHVAFDACYWTPWGTLITAEEAWATAAVGSTLPYGRLYELRNPNIAPAIVNPLTPGSNAGAEMIHQNVIPRTSHEGIQFDRAGNMYFIDELNGGTVFKYTSAARLQDVKRGGVDYFAAGQTFVLRVGDGNTANATGPYVWVPITDTIGNALPGALTIVDVNGVRSVDGRNTANLAAFKGTDYQRPEDLQIQTRKGRELMYMTTTTTNEVYVVNLAANTISVFANRSSIDLATGLPVAEGLASPDNLAIDHDGNIYIIEDRNGGVDNDIWFAKDRNLDGDLNDAGEGLARWASNGTVGSEFTGLYFDPRNKRRAWVNIQHPASGNDRTIEITAPPGRDDDDEGDDDDRDDDRDDDKDGDRRGRR
jgi:hypothetical protein